MSYDTRAAVRRAIELTWERYPRWMGVFMARYLGRLGRVPWPLYREVFTELVEDGVLRTSYMPGDDYPRYCLARLLPAPPRKGGS
jgi:hypothetical protein